MFPCPFPDDSGFKKLFHCLIAIMNRSREKTPRSRASISHIITDWWIWEISATIISLLSLMATALILYIHQGRPLPNWPYSMTINSMIAVFSTIMKSAMLLCTAECISQSKWIWFRTKEHALTDVEIFDIASRGPWGSLHMFLKVRWR